jgi:hypothetical protein
MPENYNIPWFYRQPHNEPSNENKIHVTLFISVSITLGFKRIIAQKVLRKNKYKFMFLQNL